eukprot:COSAG01_NODE_7092_length_3356_cov_3.953039_2_plen_164_part_00
MRAALLNIACVAKSLASSHIVRYAMVGGGLVSSQAWIATSDAIRTCTNAFTRPTLRWRPILTGIPYLLTSKYGNPSAVLYGSGHPSAVPQLYYGSHSFSLSLSLPPSLSLSLLLLLTVAREVFVLDQPPGPHTLPLLDELDSYIPPLYHNSHQYTGECLPLAK